MEMILLILVPMCIAILAGTEVELTVQQDVRRLRHKLPINHTRNAISGTLTAFSIALISGASGRHFVILMALILVYRWLVFDIKFNLARGRRPFQAADFNVKWPSAVTDRVAYFVLGKWYPLIMAAVKVLIIITLLALFHVKP